jgi:hypothetical protein
MDLVLFCASSSALVLEKKGYCEYLSPDTIENIERIPYLTKIKMRIITLTIHYG